MNHGLVLISVLGPLKTPDITAAVLRGYGCLLPVYSAPSNPALSLIKSAATTGALIAPIANAFRTLPMCGTPH